MEELPNILGICAHLHSMARVEGSDHADTREHLQNLMTMLRGEQPTCNASWTGPRTRRLRPQASPKPGRPSRPQTKGGNPGLTGDHNNARGPHKGRRLRETPPTGSSRSQATATWAGCHPIPNFPSPGPAEPSSAFLWRRKRPSWWGKPTAFSSRGPLPGFQEDSSGRRGNPGYAYSA